MASAVEGAVAGKLCEMTVQMAVQQLSRHASLVINFPEEFESLKKSLMFMKGFLNDAEQQCRERESWKIWMQDLRDIALRAEDIFELCTAQHLYTTGLRTALTGNHLLFRYKMARRISKVKNRIKSLNKQGALLKPDEEGSRSTLHRAYSKRSSILPIDSHPVGIDAKVERLVSMLDKPTGSVIAVVGMGGVGKTYLLQNVFDFTKDRFHKSIWLSISQTFSISKLQKDIASHLDIRDPVHRGSEQRAAELINAHLKKMKILIVLDDVCESMKEYNLIEKLGLTIGHGLKLVITSRNREVCRNVKNAEIYEMGCLSEEDSWKLFCVYGFPENERNRAPGHLEGVARNIAKECGNLPLAIKSTAASLAGITVRREWESKLRQLKEVTALNKPLEVLKLSYNSLPAHLRACFSYLSFFPKDEKIECEYLVNLWIAEGFVPDGEQQWDSGWEYLHELAYLCFLEVVEEERVEEQLYGRDIEVDVELKKYCMVHKLFLDLATLISKENKCAFDVKIAFTESPSRKNGGDWRRVLLPKKMSDYSVRKNSVDWCRVLLTKEMLDYRVIVQSVPAFSPKLLRTLSLYDSCIHKNEIPSRILMNMKVLRVLDLSRTRITTLPDCVADMKLLKVFNLSRTKIGEVPGCVRRLKSLRFLDVSFCSKLKQIPVWIGKLKCLEHINILQYAPLQLSDSFPKGISNLTSLRTLRSHRLSLSVKDEHGLKLEDVGSMTQLQELSMRLDTESQLQSIKHGTLRKLVKMRHLTVENHIENNDRFQRIREDAPLFPTELKTMRDLEKLRLQNFAVTSSLCNFVDLRELRLERCDWNGYPEFQNMPNLVSLRLECSGSCTGTEIPAAFGKSGGFPKLRLLLIEDFPGLKEFPELEDGAMPRLEVFKLHKCPSLNKLKGLEKLKMLKEFSCHGSFGLGGSYR